MASFSVLLNSNANVRTAVELLKNKEVIALPSDTLYGLAADPCSGSAVQRIYAIKGRDANKPIALCVSDVYNIPQYVDTAHLPAGLLEEILPGPVTLVLPKAVNSPLTPLLNPGFSSIGIRIPDATFIRSVAREFGAIALTSANLSGQISPTSIEDFKALWAECGAVFDGGCLGPARDGSTVVDLTMAGSFQIIRAGSALQLALGVIRDNYGLAEGKKSRH